MNKEKLASLTKYLAKQKELLSNPQTDQQATKQYKEFLEKDIQQTTAKIDIAKIAAVPASK